jgi:hypothetical protein
MKTLPKTLVLAALSLSLLGTDTLAQRQLGKKKGPTSKLYLAETKGEGQIITEGKAYEPRQATAFDAPGTVIETKNDAHQAYVYSNGTGMYVDANTRVEIARFIQEPFQPDRNNLEREPSMSQSDVFVARGLVGLCTSQLVTGTTMTYTTPLAAVTIRGHKLAIQSSPEASIVYLLEGDVTVRTRDDLGGRLLNSGEQAVIRPGQPGQPPSVTIAPIDREMISALDEKVSIACNAKKTVSFETIERKAAGGASGESAVEEEIVPRPTVTETVPSNIPAVSASRIEPSS